MKVQLDHLVLNVQDIEAVIRFYTEVLGLPAERLAQYRAGQVKFPSVRINSNTIIDLFPVQATAENQFKQNLAHFCLALEKEEWMALQSRLKAYRVPILHGPVKNWGARGDAISIYFPDPQGNEIEVRYYEPTPDRE